MTRAQLLTMARERLSQLRKRELHLLVCHHQREMLTEVPELDGIHKVWLEGLSLPRHLAGNYLGESRAFMSDVASAIPETAAYVGQLNARSHRKYPGFAWQTTVDKARSMLNPKVVIGLRGAPANWASQSDDFHPGMMPFLEELAEFTKMPLETSWPSVYAHDFVCARIVWLDWLNHFRTVTNHFVGKYGVSLEGFPAENLDSKRKTAFTWSG